MRHVLVVVVVVAGDNLVANCQELVCGSLAEHLVLVFVEFELRLDLLVREVDRQ